MNIYFKSVPFRKNDVTLALESGVDGVIVPMDNAGCAAGIAALLRDPEKMSVISEACRRGDYSNAGQAEKLMELLK